MPPQHGTTSKNAPAWLPGAGSAGAQLEATQQLAAAAMDARLDGARRQVEQGFELSVREPFEVAQREDERRLRIELAQRRLDLGEQLAVLGQGGGVARVAQGVDRLQRQEAESPLEPPATIVVDAEVAREAERPRQQWDVAAEASEVLEQAQEDLLGEVLGALGVAAEVQGDGVDARAEPVDDLAPGCGFAGRGPAGEA